MTVADPFELSYKELRRRFVGAKNTIWLPCLVIFLGIIAVALLANNIAVILLGILFFALLIFVSVYGIEREQTLVRKYYEKENNLK